MKKRAPIGIFLIAFVCLMVGCQTGPEEILEVSHTIIPKEKTIQNVYIPEQIRLGTYEPAHGIYVGAFVESNQDVAGDMKRYEALMQKEQAFRVFQYQKRGDLTSQEVLECIAAKQVPYIKILANTTYDLMPIYEMVGDLNTKYQTPIFIELFPLQDDTLDPVQYVKYYEEAYKLIKKYLKDAVVVWSIDWNSAYAATLYYPGSHIVDWVGLNVSLPKYKDGRAYEPEYREKMDFWYKQFQDEKPMLLSTLAVSHFSRVDHTYTLEDTKNKLTYFYETVPKLYPRIKAVLYGDVDMYYISPQGTEDYRLTSQDKLMTHIQSLWDKHTYLSEVESEEVTIVEQPMLYTVPAYRMNDGLYITEEQLQVVCRHKAFIKYMPCVLDETGKKYYDLNAIVTVQGGWVEQENLQN